jgi:hypothetical protein
MDTLLPLYVHPLADPAAWTAASRGGRDITVIVNLREGPERAPTAADPDPAYAAATGRLATAGVPMLGRVDLSYATRRPADIVGDVARWSGYPVNGVFLDRAPTSPFSIGPVALAIRAARRAGVGDRIVINPGVPTDALYRGRGAQIVVYEGHWNDYLQWNGDGAQTGDGHLVYGVPPARLATAWRMLEARGAGFGLATDLDAPNPYAGVPAWCAGMAPVG